MIKVIKFRCRRVDNGNDDLDVQESEFELENQGSLIHIYTNKYLLEKPFRQKGLTPTWALIKKSFFPESIPIVPQGYTVYIHGEPIALVWVALGAPASFDITTSPWTFIGRETMAPKTGRYIGSKKWVVILFKNGSGVLQSVSPTDMYLEQEQVGWGT